MSLLERLTDMAYVWGSVAFASAWQGTILAMVAVTLLSRFKRISAATRGAVWWVLLLGAIAIPAYMAWPIATTAPDAVRPQVQTVLVIRDGTPPVSSYSHGIGPGSAQPVTRKRPPLARALVVSPAFMRTLAAMWMVIASILLARLAFGVAAILSIKRRSTPAPAQVRALFDGLGGKPVAVRLTDDLPVPCVVGYLRPVVLLPGGTLHQLDDTTLGHVLLHELAHVRRRDVWSALVLRIVRALTFPLPSTYIIAERLEIDQELASDEWALNRSGAKATDYVNSLLQIGEATVGSRMKRRALAPAAVTQLRSRVESLLRDNVRPSPVHACVRGAFIGTGLVGALVPLSAIAPAFALVAFSTNQSPPVSQPAALPIAIDAHSQLSPAALDARPPASISRMSRDRVARAPSPLATSDTVNALIAQLRAPDAGSRARAAFSISHHRRAALGATAALIALLGDDARVARESDALSKAWSVREDRDATSPAEEATKALLYIGRDALAQVKGALETMNGRGRERAEWVAGLLKNYD